MAPIYIGTNGDLPLIKFRGAHLHDVFVEILWNLSKKPPSQLGGLKYEVVFQEGQNWWVSEERHNSIANALELRLSRTNPAKCASKMRWFVWRWCKCTRHVFEGDFNGLYQIGQGWGNHIKSKTFYYFDGIVQERHNSSALAMELCLSCTNPPISSKHFKSYDVLHAYFQSWRSASRRH